MGSMLVNNEQLFIVLHHPVGVKQLADKLVLQPGLGVQKLAVKQVQLFRPGGAVGCTGSCMGRSGTGCV